MYFILINILVKRFDLHDGDWDTEHLNIKDFKIYNRGTKSIGGT